jgi:hypothetical protein
VGECGTVKSGDAGKGAYRLYKNEYTSISLLTQLIYNTICKKLYSK